MKKKSKPIECTATGPVAQRIRGHCCYSNCSNWKPRWGFGNPPPNPHPGSLMIFLSLSLPLRASSSTSESYSVWSMSLRAAFFLGESNGEKGAPDGLDRVFKKLRVCSYRPMWFFKSTPSPIPRCRPLCWTEEEATSLSLGLPEEVYSSPPTASASSPHPTQEEKETCILAI